MLKETIHYNKFKHKNTTQYEETQIILVFGLGGLIGSAGVCFKVLGPLFHLLVECHINVDEETNVNHH